MKNSSAAHKKKKRGTETSSFGTKGRISHDSSRFYKSRLYNSFETAKSVPLAEKRLPAKHQNRVIVGSSENMRELPSGCIHMMVTSPPYNASKEYDNDLTLAEYLELLKKVFSETHRVLVEGGRACINVANLGRKPYIPLSDHISRMMTDIGFNMRGEIIWNKAASASPSTAWGSWQSAANPILRDIHEYILIFSKGTYSRDPRENTISREQFLEWTKSIWTMKSESARKVGHPAPFPEELPRRLIQLYTFKGDVVLDPFMGSGTTGMAAIRSGRKFVGYEISKEYAALAARRIGGISP